MASKKHNDIQVSNSSIHTEALKTHSTNINSSKMESVNITNVTNENDRNSNLSPSKSADPARKKTFKIISVKKGGSGSGDLAGDNDGDSIDGLDESQTEDLSSEFYDSSKATDLDMDFQDNLMPLTPDEVTSSTTIVVKTKPDRDAQSRFKVVKIETKEPFRRGKWICYDFFDTAPASLVAVEKNGSRITDESIITSALSGNLSSSSSVHYLHDVNDSSSNIYVSPFVPISPAGTDGQVFPDVFVPIQPAPASQVLNQYDGISSAEAVAPFIAQQVFMSMAGVPTSSTSFYSLAQPGHMAIIQSLPTTNVFPYNAQNGPLPTLYQNGISGPATLPDSLIVSSGTIPSVIPPGITSVPPVAVADVPVVNTEQSQGFVVVGGVTVPHSQSQTQISGVPLVSQILPPVNESLQAGASGLVNTASIPPSGTTDVMTTSGTLEVEQMGSGMDESTGSIKTLQGDPEDHPPQGLEEAVETMYKGLEGVEDEVDESGGSTVAIDNKIEQAMDLVKRHLMYAVREEVEILKQQIGEMMERIGQLEYENTVLKAEAKPETLNKLLQPRAPTAAPLTAPVSVMSTQSQQQTNTMQSAAPQSQTQVQIQTPASAPAVVVQQQSAQQAQLPQSQASQPSLQAPHPPT